MPSFARTSPCSGASSWLFAGSARLGGQAGHVARLPADQVHVAAIGPDVFGRDVPAAQRVDETTVRAQQFLVLDPLRITDDDGLPTAQVQAGGGRLVSHPA